MKTAPRKRTLRFDTMDSLHAWAKRRTNPSPTPRLCPSEEQEQMTLIDWAWNFQSFHPELSLLYHIPNGGYRKMTEAVRFAKMGVRPGIPDLHLPVARHSAHSLYLELKAQDGSPTVSQIERAIDLATEGNIVAFCFGFEQARDTLLWYLSPDEGDMGEQ